MGTFYPERKPFDYAPIFRILNLQQKGCSQRRNSQYTTVLYNLVSKRPLILRIASRR